jgi:hypothetical protein
MDRLAVASANAKEIIGKDLLDAMSMIAGKDGIGGATSAMEGFATEIGNAIYGIGVLTSKLNALPGAGAITDFLSAPTGLLQLFSLFGKSQKAATGQASPGGAGGIVARIKYQKELDRLAREKIKTDKIDNANTLRKLVLTGDQLALQELEKKFDVERIGLFSAMNQATDGETKMRLLSLIAIHDQNAALAGQIKKTDAATDAMEAFRQAILASIRALLDKIAAEQAKLMEVLGITATTPGSSSFLSNDPTAVSGGIPGTAVSMGFGAGTFRQAEAATTNIQVNVAGSVTTERDLVSAITQGIYNNQASGIPISYTTAFR